MNNPIYTTLINERNALIKENSRLRSALKIKGILWHDSKEYTCTNGKGKELTEPVVTGEI